MGSTSTIEWTQATWNPVRGCSRISPGCVNCYAERMAARGLPGHRSPTTGEPFAILTPSGPRWTGKVELIPHMLDIPFRRRKPTTYFVNSMSDLFHEDLPFEEIDRVVSEIAGAGRHTFQVLTKRASRMRAYFKRFKPDGRGWVTPGGLDAEETHCPINAQKWPIPNLWLGVSVEDQQRADKRIPELLATPAAVRFLSVEPLLGPVDLAEYFGWNAEVAARGIKQPLASALLTLSDVPGIDWVIVGGESGPGARPCDLAWIRSIVAQCKAAGVPCFVKQLGARPYFRDGEWDAHPQYEDRKGGDMSEWPADLRIREFPAVSR